MNVLLPESIDDAVEALASDPELDIVAGGTDLMVDVNYGRRRPRRVLGLRHLDALRTWERHDDRLEIGACVTYDMLLGPDIAAMVPALAQAARTVGSPQIRAAGTIGGNVATASPAGDTLPVLAALDAAVTLRSATGERAVPITEFITGPKQTTRRRDELLVSVSVPLVAGPQHYLKVGVRNAMVIAVTSVAVIVDLDRETVRVALGSCGPVPMRCTAAETWVAPMIDWTARRVDDPRTYEAFGARCAETARPIDDHRSTAAYRRHACAVLARRGLARCL